MAHNPIAALLVAAALAGTPAYAASSRTHALKRAAHPAAVHPLPTDQGLDGVLVAPGCPSCVNQANSPSLIDWLKAQIARLAA